MSRSNLTVKALILNRKNIKEHDRIITLLCQERGRFTAIAKGVRKLSARRQGYLEPGNIVKAQIIEVNIPIIGQVMLIEDTKLQDLAHIRKMSLLLEFFERLFVEEAIDQELFSAILNLRNAITSRTISHQDSQSYLSRIIQKLGFSTQEHQNSLSSLIEELSGRKLKSYQFLTVKN